MPLNYRQIANIAITYKTLFWEFLERDDGPNPSMNSIPYIVNASLACEMYMKALIVYFDPTCTERQLKKWRHDLYVLFNQLPNNIKNRIKINIPDSEIKSRYDKLISDYNKAIQDSRTTSEHKKDIKKIISNPNPPVTFDAILSQHKDTYVEWRYLYGNDGSKIKSCDEWFLASFIMELHNTMVGILSVN